MGLLAGFMTFFINLVQLQVAAKQYKLQKTAATKGQVDGLERTLNASPPSSHPEPQSTPPTDPDNPDNSQSDSEPPDKELSPRYNQPVLPTPPPPHPVNLFPDPEASYVTINEASPPDQPTVADSSPVRIELRVRRDGGSESRTESGDIYVPTALFAPPKTAVSSRWASTQ
ncbi:hypothetical protein BDW71DRAFT_211692 [Aspergillus fruticulosus]